MNQAMSEFHIYTFTGTMRIIATTNAQGTNATYGSGIINLYPGTFSLDYGWTKHVIFHELAHHFGASLISSTERDRDYQFMDDSGFQTLGYSPYQVPGTYINPGEGFADCMAEIWGAPYANRAHYWFCPQAVQDQLNVWHP